MKSALQIVLAAAVAMALTIAVFHDDSVAAKAKPSFEVGHAYGFLWGVSPDEVLIVDQVLDDGWLRVHEPTNPRPWFINTRQALAFTRVEFKPASAPAPPARESDESFTVTH